MGGRKIHEMDRSLWVSFQCRLLPGWRIVQCMGYCYHLFCGAFLSISGARLSAEVIFSLRRGVLPRHIARPMRVYSAFVHLTVHGVTTWLFNRRSCINRPVAKPLIEFRITSHCFYILHLIASQYSNPCRTRKRTGAI